MSEVPVITQVEAVQYEPNDLSMTLEDALNYTPKNFDYDWLEGNSAHRQEQKARFVNDGIYTPNYDYAKMRDRTSGDLDVGNVRGTSAQEINTISDAIAVVEANRAELGNDIADLYISRFDVLMGRELLVELAQLSLTAGGADAREKWRAKFNEVSEVLYGPLDESLYLGIMATEKQRVIDFVPQDELGQTIQSQILKFFEGIDVGDNKEDSYIDQELIETYKPLIDNLYGHILGVVPDTDDSVIYDAYQSCKIMNHALEVAGLAISGWEAEVDSNKTAVSTNTSLKKISLPESDKRTATQLKALILHEQEVHARRGQNGLESKLPGLLSGGTANYSDSEEGLGIALECIVNGTAEGNVAIKRARDRYINVGLALGAGTEYPRDAREVFEIAWRIEALAAAGANGGSMTAQIINQAKNGKWGSVTHLENIFRGTSFTGKGNIYSKAKVYLEGFTKSVRKLRQINGDEVAFKELFIGKYDHTDDEETAIIKRVA